MLDDQLVEQGRPDGIDVVESGEVGHIILISGQMDDAVDTVESPTHRVCITHVPDDFFHVPRQVGRPAVGMDSLLERVEDADLVAALQQDIGRVGADEAGAAGDQNALQREFSSVNSELKRTSKYMPHLGLRQLEIR